VHRALVSTKNVEEPVTVSEGLATEIVCARQFRFSVTEQVI